MNSWGISLEFFLPLRVDGSVSRPLHSPGGVVYTAAERAEVHAEYLAGVFGGNPSGDAAVMNSWGISLEFFLPLRVGLLDLRTVKRLGPR
ncbi:hypothetical protein QE152_g39882 [Popillia japonica]|uniref:Uncharacterized protein n=1 Tax=Popillia japonica TaxID=7064 RepID=A0AAW1HTE9_POPJA